MKANINLIMTLLVRDEEDILENNICFHLNQGIDKILVIDNGSIDGTVDILEKYKKKGVLEYRIIKEHTYEQDKWVSSLAREAVEKYNATHLVHCDADEFWMSNNSDLKKAILMNCDRDLIYVRVINYVPPVDLSLKSVNFDNFNHIVAKTSLVPGYFEDKISSKVLFYTYPNKIITTSKFTSIGYGNDTVVTNEEINSVITDNIYIHHFPIRNWSHFQRKVINGGSSYKNNPINDPNIGWHWKKWFVIYESGKLLEEYEKLSLKNDLEDLINMGDVKFSRVPRKIKYSSLIYKIKNFF